MASRAQLRQPSRGCEAREGNLWGKGWGGRGGGTWSTRLDKASDLPLAAPLRQTMVYLYATRVAAHLACLLEVVRAVEKYSRFLWSV